MVYYSQDTETFSAFLSHKNSARKVNNHLESQVTEIKHNTTQLITDEIRTGIQLFHYLN